MDILVNNAGLQRVSPIEELDPEVFHTMLMIMVEAPFRLIRSALPYMYAHGYGRIVNVSSVHGLRASAYKSAYVTAKHALEGLSKVTALEGGPHGVTSNCVNPGYVRTPLVEQQISDQARIHGITEAAVLETIMLTHRAIKRLVEPAEVAALVGWLVGPDAAMVTGASYTMDGGGQRSEQLLPADQCSSRRWPVARRRVESVRRYDCRRRARDHRQPSHLRTAGRGAARTPAAGPIFGVGEPAVPCRGRGGSSGTPRMSPG